MKVWVWDIRGQMEQAPDPTEDGIVQERHLRDVLATVHDYDGVSTFPKIVKEQNTRQTNAKRQRRASPPPSGRYGVTKVMKIQISDDEEEKKDTSSEVNRQQSSPPPMPTYEPITPPNPPPPPYEEEDDGSRPPRLHRPKPHDPRLHRHPQPPPSPTAQREEAGRLMGLDSYVVENMYKVICW